MNSLDLGEVLHVIGSDSAAGCLFQAFKLHGGQILVNEDQLSCGPMQATRDLELWRTMRENYIREMCSHGWPDFSFDHYANNGLLINAERLRSETPVVVWTSCGLADQLLLSWVVFLFDQMEQDASTINVIEFERWPSGKLIMSMGLLSPEIIREHHPVPCQLGCQRADELRRVWAAYTSNDPSLLIDYLEAPEASSLLKTAMRSLVHRYPDVRTGLSVWDERLLQFVAGRGPRAVQVIGFTMGLADTPDLVGDPYLFSRLNKLGSNDLASPLVSLPNPMIMRECEVKLTAFGHDVLTGKGNHAQKNVIDDWVGGVHISSRKHITFRDGDALTLP